MNNSDYLLKATIKKVSEKLNEIVSDKIEEATNLAQDVPEIIKKEFFTLKNSIIEEATRIEYEMNLKNNKQTTTSNQDSKLTNALKEIEEINSKIENLNKII